MRITQKYFPPNHDERPMDAHAFLLFEKSGKTRADNWASLEFFSAPGSYTLSIGNAGFSCSAVIRNNSDIMDTSLYSTLQQFHRALDRSYQRKPDTVSTILLLRELPTQPTVSFRVNTGTNLVLRNQQDGDVAFEITQRHLGHEKTAVFSLPSKKSPPLLNSLFGLMYDAITHDRINPPRPHGVQAACYRKHANAGTPQGRL